MFLPVLALCFWASVTSLYLPGVVPHDYQDQEEVHIKVNMLDSVKTQLPFDYYNLPFCRPAEPIHFRESLGEYLSGNRVENSPYIVNMMRDETCRALCRVPLDANSRKLLATRIKQDYRVNMEVDNLPAFTRQTFEVNGELFDHFRKGYPLGFIGSVTSGNRGKPHLYNHIRLTVLVHPVPNGHRIVGFEIEPFSVQHSVEGKVDKDTKLPSCADLSAVSPLLLDSPATTEVIYSYDVLWRESNIKWASRWDIYLRMTDSQIHWFSIINSIMIVVFLTGMVALIMMRTLHRDLLRYNQSEVSEESPVEESGWKLVHADVFRAPAHAEWLALCVGTGSQVIVLTLLSLVFAVLGFFSPGNRGSWMNALLLASIVLGFVSGYVGTRLYSMFGGAHWKQNAFRIALVIPGLCFSIFVCLNLAVQMSASSGAIPNGEMVFLLSLWFGLSVPLVYAGSYVAASQTTIKPPTKVNQIPREIPPQAWFLQFPFSICVGGVLPFGAVFIEVFFVMSSIWLHQFYYVFGFLLAVFLVLFVTCAEISIVMCYFQLCSEDYRWWWRSFLTSGSSALYLFLYSILYFATKLDITKFVSSLLFFGYMSVLCLLFFLLTGTMGFGATLFFVRKIYGAVKID